MLKLKAKPFILSAALALSLTAGMHKAAAEEMSGLSSVESGIVMKEVSEVDSGYCHIKYMAFTERGLKSGDLEFNENDVIDYYGSCSFEPKNAAEVKKQLASLTSEISNDSESGD